jgi:hypothetical protein
MAAVIARILLAGLGALLIEASLRKMEHRTAFATAVRSWRFVPAGLRSSVVPLLPRAEAVAGGLVLWASVSGHGVWTASLAAASLFAAFALIQTVLVAFSQNAECGCFGHPEPVSRASIARPTALGLLAVISLLLTA